MSVVFVGIDPGLDGAIATLPPIAAGAPRVWDMPTYFKTKTRRGYDVQGLWSLLQNLAGGGEDGCWPLLIAIEKQQPTPVTKKDPETGGTRINKGSIANYSIGWCAGMLTGLCTAGGYAHTEVASVQWKKGVLGHLPKTKDGSRIWAQRMFPRVIFDPTSSRDEGLNLKKHHGRADAIALAVYASRYLNR